MLRVAQIVLLTTAVLTACSDPTAPAPEPPALPEPDTVLDPERLVIGEILANPGCDRGAHDHLRRMREWRIVDVFFPGGSAGEMDGPDAAQIRAVTTRGGVVLHRFNVPAVRAWIRLDRVPGLVESEARPTVRSVPDLRRYDYRVLAGYDREMKDADARTIRQLGGRVRHRMEAIEFISAALPDHSVPALRAADGVDFVEHTMAVMCVLD